MHPIMIFFGKAMDGKEFAKSPKMLNTKKYVYVLFFLLIYHLCAYSIYTLVVFIVRLNKSKVYIFKKSTEHYEGFLIMIFKKLYEKCKALLSKETDYKKLALAWSMAIYIALCPLIGIHTILVFVLARLFSINTALFFTMCTLIHNPWTAVPIYGFDYAFGQWLFDRLGIDSMQWNPTWMESVNEYISHHIGIKGLSLWAFFIGGNILALSISLIVYPILRYLLRRRAERRALQERTQDLLE